MREVPGSIPGAALMRTANTIPLPRSCHIKSAGRTQARHAVFINGVTEASINADPLGSGLGPVLCQSTGPKRLKRGRQSPPSWLRSPSAFMKCLNGPSQTPGRTPSTFINHQAILTWGTWCSGITSASHAEGPGFKSQCVHVCRPSRFSFKAPGLDARRNLVTWIFK